MFVGSDFGGYHKGSRFLVFGYLVCGRGMAPWNSLRTSVRDAFLGDGRRISFKRLNNSYTRDALEPFLQATDALHGKLVCFMVDKRLFPLNKAAKGGPLLASLKGKWSDKGFDDAFMKALLFSAVSAKWLRPNSNVSWVTDQDPFIANENYHDDMLSLSARLCALSSQKPIRQFALVSTEDDLHDRMFEDFVAIPDLAVGMLAELGTSLRDETNWQTLGNLIPHSKELQEKTSTIMDWFWSYSPFLEKTCIVIDKAPEGIRAFRLDRFQ